MSSSVIGTNVKAITGLYAAGELAEDTHGNNRRGGDVLFRADYDPLVGLWQIRGPSTPLGEWTTQGRPVETWRRVDGLETSP